MATTSLMDTCPISRLVNLASELLGDIFAYLDQTTLTSVSLSCRRLRDSAEPFLYSTIHLRDRSGSSLLRTIRNRPSLASLVHNITFIYDKTCADEHVAESSLLLPNLHDITVASLWEYDEDDWNSDDEERVAALGFDWFPLKEPRLSAVFRKARFGGTDILKSLQSCGSSCRLSRFWRGPSLHRCCPVYECI